MSRVLQVTTKHFQWFTKSDGNSMRHGRNMNERYFGAFKRGLKRISKTANDYTPLEIVNLTDVVIRFQRD